MPVCLVYTCFNTRLRKPEGVTFHKLPKDITWRNAWLEAVQRTPVEHYSDANVVCSQHFLPEDFVEYGNMYVHMKTYLGECRDLSGQHLIYSKKKTPFIGFIITINSIIGLYDHYVKIENSPLKYLLTYKFSQDHIELFFCWIRSRNGWNNNPTCAQFINTYKRLLLHHEIKKVSGNCIPLDTTEILTVSSRNTEKQMDSINLSDVSVSRKYNLDFDSPEKDDIPFVEDVPLTESIENVICYISGYVIKMVTKRIKCRECLFSLHENIVCVDDSRMALINRKDKGGLLRPSKSVTTICRSIEVKIRRTLMLTSSKVPPESSYMKILSYSVVQHFLQDGKIFPELENHIYGGAFGEELHKKKLIKAIVGSYVRIRMFHIRKIHNEEIRGDLVRKLFTKLILFKNQ